MCLNFTPKRYEKPQEDTAWNHSFSHPIGSNSEVHHRVRQSSTEKEKERYRGWQSLFYIIKQKKNHLWFPNMCPVRSCWPPDIFHGVKPFPSMSIFAFLLLLRWVALLTVWLYYNKQSLMTPSRPLYPYCPPSFFSLTHSLCRSFSAFSSGSSSAAN